MLKTAKVPSGLLELATDITTAAANNNSEGQVATPPSVVNNCIIEKQ